MSYRLLGPHVNALVSGLGEALTVWKPPLVVSLDHSDSWHRIKAASPKSLFVGRTYQPYEPDWNTKIDPIATARAHCDMILPWAERMGEVYTFWQGVNEPVVSSAEAMRRLSDFDAERARIMSGHGFRVVVGSFSVGNPGQLAWWSDFLPALEAARQYRGALALHEYAWPVLEQKSPWYLLRHRKVYGGEPAHGWSGFPRHLKNLPLLITECGLDGGIEREFAGCSWRTRYTAVQFLEQLAWYDAELQKDPYVMGAALYCCCASADTLWQSFNIWPELVEALARDAHPLYRSPVCAEPQPAEEPELPMPAVKVPSPPESLPDDRLDEVMVRLDRIVALLRKRGSPSGQA